MMKKYIVILMILIGFSLLLAGCASDSANPYVDLSPGNSYIDLSPEEAKELIDNTPDLIIIDVSPFYAQGHIPGSINYYLGDGSLDTAIPMLDQSKTYLVYCHVDSVSIAGANKLIEAGFKNVYRLEGNYSAWVESGYLVENS
jgi:rhodanese-related sulfurtransferase